MRTSTVTLFGLLLAATAMASSGLTGSSYGLLQRRNYDKPDTAVDSGSDDASIVQCVQMCLKTLPCPASGGTDNAKDESKDESKEEEGSSDEQNYEDEGDDEQNYEDEGDDEQNYEDEGDDEQNY
ncbi:hypothetical protein BJ684DRAFT_20046 [Piptocephalis cylindrospora]|uniref:Uncharacterized protein n=1 Tax=Piptocephalis cylindrospora TaxID=1907219 RepID=A0A4P9Y3H7_9FUNG|nr:hypothetical protein BJ684DRAFT_20046 [Piptocephalis cylindrospora]|eukprot:RKP13467.1 hypothetical protein BJ684DRAFT_20046 [Piptocephalis cylindrospora]